MDFRTGGRLAPAAAGPAATMPFGVPAGVATLVAIVRRSLQEK